MLDQGAHTAYNLEEAVASMERISRLARRPRQQARRAPDLGHDPRGAHAEFARQVAPALCAQPVGTVLETDAQSHAQVHLRVDMGRPQAVERREPGPTGLQQQGELARVTGAVTDQEGEYQPPEQGPQVDGGLPADTAQERRDLAQPRSPLPFVGSSRRMTQGLAEIFHVQRVDVATPILVPVDPRHGEHVDPAVQQLGARDGQTPRRRQRHAKRLVGHGFAQARTRRLEHVRGERIIENAAHDAIDDAHGKLVELARQSLGQTVHLGQQGMDGQGGDGVTQLVGIKHTPRQWMPRAQPGGPQRQGPGPFPSDARQHAEVVALRQPQAASESRPQRPVRQQRGENRRDTFPGVHLGGARQGQAGGRQFPIGLARIDE